VKIVARIVLAIVLVAVVLYFGALGFLYVKQRDYQYFPGGELTALNQTGLTRAQAVGIPTEGGATLGAWYAPPVGNKPVILYYKGNTASFSAEHERFKAWEAAGYGFLAFDYRGFPASPGTISQEAILADSLAVFDWLGERGGRIVIWGRSLGTGPATFVASRREADALLLETPFLSAVSVAAERYPFFPVSWVMKDPFPSNQWMKLVEEPVFIAHGTADRTIDVSNGERLYQLVPHKYDLWIEPGADHSDLWARGIWARAQSFFEDAEHGAQQVGRVVP